MHLKFCMTILFLVINFFFPVAFYGNDAAFPVYPSMEPNVKFWIKVYSEYSTNQGILHDRQNLNVIYEVVELLSPDGFGSKTINE
ncbi:MAG: hypothetical protein PVG86_11165, partial [Desulfobacterales bacterium]